MPYPVYSFVVIETTTNNVTTSETVPYKQNEDAKNAYKVAIDAGKRAFLYEQPHPSKFRRNDSQPISP